MMNNWKDDIHLDFRSGVPIYLQIVEQVKQQVMSGALTAGEQLPTVRALALELRVNFNTVARAYRLLDEAGIISTQRGRGTYITEIPPPETLERMRRESLEALTQHFIDDASRLGFSGAEIGQMVSSQLQAWKRGARHRRRSVV
ncbi:MAG: GntR family transcriptional regulator [Anaerolineales bacterium]